jgi:hypothetical protein
LGTWDFIGATITLIVVCWTIAIDQGVAMPPSHSQQQRQDAMQQVYVSDKGDDKNDGLSLEAPIKSLKRLCILWSGRELVLMEGRETFNRLVDEMVVFVRFAKAASKNEYRASEAPKPDTSSP